MGRAAFVFSGQGDQFSGMGKRLAAHYTVAADVFRMCDRIRPGTSAQCFEGSEAELKHTENTQPCLFALELAIAAVLKSGGVRAEAAAGFSLGEVVACTFAGMLTPEAGFRLVCKRGRLMEEAAKKQDASMAAVIGLTKERVIALCAELAAVYPVNFNCPGQIVVAGRSDQMPALRRAVREAGGRTVPLKVGGAFHSPFMREAAEAFARELEKLTLQKPAVMLYSNATALPYQGDFRKLLSEQICSPVLWELLIRNSISAGIDTFIEIGPGKTLTNLIRRIDADVKTYAVADFLKL